MALIATAGTTFTPVPQGNHIGRCYRVIDLGTQKTEYKGKTRKFRKVMLTWELFGEDEDGKSLVTDDGRPLSISKRYTLSLNEKASMRADFESWRGRAFTEDELQGFELEKLIGVYGLINVKHEARDGKIYANVAAISPLPKAMRENKPIPVNKNQYFEVTDPNMELFETFTENLQAVIRDCDEWNKETPNETARKVAFGDGSEGAGGLDSDIPFN